MGGGGGGGGGGVCERDADTKKHTRFKDLIEGLSGNDERVTISKLDLNPFFLLRTEQHKYYSKAYYIQIYLEKAPKKKLS